MTKQGPEAAAAARLAVRLAARKRADLLDLIRPAFRRTGSWLQAGKYLSAVMSDLPRRNGWTIARQVGDRSPDRTQRLLNRAAWDEAAAMSVVRRFAVAGLDRAAARFRGRRRLAVGALDETGQEKHGSATAGVKRQHMGCAGGVENGINTVHLSYVREGCGHALIGAAQWIPAGQIADPVRSLEMALPSNFRVTLAAGVTLTCAEAVRRLGGRLRWEVRSAGSGSKGERWYAWAMIGTASPRRSLLIRRHLRSGELAFHYCFVPAGQPAGMGRLIRAAGLRWPAEEDFEFGKDGFGLDQSQVRLYHAIARHTVLVMAALAICAVTAAQLRDRTDRRAPAPDHHGQVPPAGTWLIPLTVPEVRRLIAAAATRLWPPGHIEHWSAWMRAHQARARWFHQRARLERDQEITMNPLVI